ncbi:MAG: acyltransferase [Clostridia bacterium]|nr:acyltransferase [Clostridia bacterium]
MAKKGLISFSSPVSCGMVHFNSNVGTRGILSQPSVFEISGNLILGKGILFGKGAVIRVAKNATLVIGNNLTCNKNLYIQCEKEIVIGNHCLFGWCTSIRDTDGHQLLSNNSIINNSEKIIIGEKVWIASNVDVLKGAIIPNGCVVGTRTLVNKKFDEEGILIVGIPSKKVKSNIKWEV